LVANAGRRPGPGLALDPEPVVVSAADAAVGCWTTVLGWTVWVEVSAAGVTVVVELGDDVCAGRRSAAST
jgi:hypothetical protein